MKIAITGGTGFVGRNIARHLAQNSQDVVLIARTVHPDPAIYALPRTSFIPTPLSRTDELTRAFEGCEAIVHCAGINREIGEQTFEEVHIEGTRRVVDAARKVGAKKLILTSFLRARPDCGSEYHESKWGAEEIVRHSGLDYCILKCGVIYGPGDHMLNHLSRAFSTFPVFAFVGFRDKPIRPTSVEDVARIAGEVVLHGALSRKTVPVVGPEALTLREAVRRVAAITGRRPVMFPMPIWFHYALAYCFERIMRVPLVSAAQVRMLCEGLVEVAPDCDLMPCELAPRIVFGPSQIRAGLPVPRRLNWRDLRGFRCHNSKGHSQHSKRVFFEMP